MSDNLSKVNWNDYQKWEQVTLPSGAVLYLVPGTGYAYDPFLSQIKGKPFLWNNPKSAMEAKKTADEQQKEAFKSQQFARSPEGQLIPVAGGVAGTLGGAYAINKYFNGSSADIAKKVVDSAVTPAVSPTNIAPAPVTPPTAPAPTVSAPAQSFTGSAAPTFPVGTAADGSTLMSDGTTAGSLEAPNVVSATRIPGEAPSGITLGQGLQGGLGALQAFQGINQIHQGDKLGGGLNVIGGGTAVGAALGNQTAQAALPYVGPVVGAYGAYKTDQMVGSMPSGGRRNTDATLSGAAAGAGLGSFAGPVGMGIGAAVGGALGFADSYFGSSKDKYQMARDQGRKYLQSQGILDSNWQGTLADGSKFDFGKDGKEAGKLNTSDPNWGQVVGLGNVIAAAEGNVGQGRDAMVTLYTNAALSNANGDYAKALSNMQHFAQERGINADNAKAQIDKMHADGTLADADYEAISNGIPVLFGAPPPSPVATKAARSSTVSPGISKDGRRLSAAEIGKQLAGRINARA